MDLKNNTSYSNSLKPHMITINHCLVMFQHLFYIDNHDGVNGATILLEIWLTNVVEKVIYS